MIADGESVREVRLDDPERPRFLDLPAADLPDGRSLRRAAFEAWAANVRAALGRTSGWETALRPARPIATALAIAGASLVAALAVSLLATWTLRPTAPVEVEPTTVESAGLVLAVAIVVAVLVQSLVGLARAWVCRRGSYVHVDVHGFRTSKGGQSEPFATVARASFHPCLRCTRIDFADGRAPLWVPAERGPLRRLDLVLGALGAPTSW